MFFFFTSHLFLVVDADGTRPYRNPMNILDVVASEVNQFEWAIAKYLLGSF